MTALPPTVFSGLWLFLLNKVPYKVLLLLNLKKKILNTDTDWVENGL